MEKKQNTWVKEYIDSMLARADEQAMELKLNNFPNALFKYRKLDENTFDSLQKNELWLSEIDTLNDPFECSMLLNHDECLRMTYQSEKYRKNFRQRFGFDIPQEILEKIAGSSKPVDIYRRYCESKNIVFSKAPEEEEDITMNRWQEIREDTNKNIRVSCFSERNDSILMWSHYAAQHKGICIEYDFTEAEEIRYLIQPAYYSDEVFQIRTMEDLNSVNHMMSSLYKAKDWSYEEEWRLTGIPKTDGKVPEKVSAPVPKNIYLGTRFKQNAPALRNKLFEIAKSQNIPIVEMSLHRTLYKIVKK